MVASAQNADVADKRRRIRVPHLTRVELESFSLYRLRPVLDVAVNDGVFCLAGANGLGKSSFIAALGYGFTGTVPPASPNAADIPKYYRDSVKYADRYFTGRIREMDRGAAAITLEFSLNQRRYRITRKFFEPNALQHFEIRDNIGNIVVRNDTKLDDEDRHDLYADHLVKDCGLQSFSQFVFLNHFLFTFDERRHLLFWDARASEQVLYLALGLDPSLAKRASELRKAAAGAGSLARNAQFAATAARQELRRLNEALGGQSSVDNSLLARYRNLVNERREATAERSRLSKEHEDAQLELATASAQQLRLRHEYEEAFNRRYQSRTATHLHSIVSQTLSDHLCRVCGKQHQSGPEHVEQAIRDGRCPMCSAETSKAASFDQGSAELLTNIDQALSLAATKSAESQTQVKRLAKLLEDARRGLNKLNQDISKIESEDEIKASDLDRMPADELAAQANSIRSAIDIQLARKDHQLQLRAEAQAEYEPIRNELVRAWRDAELEFVPAFRRLAEGFIGLQLSVQLDEGPGQTGSAHLALAVDSSHRREPTQLSESQRFFLDIALRMSLAEFMSPDDAAPTIYVDTPEGALDIAYEARAGDMFSHFALAGNQLIMTANVNTSQLLRRLAKRCSATRMKLIRMTEWTTLSDVQIQEEDLFEEAFEAIETALIAPDLRGVLDE